MKRPNRAWPRAIVEIPSTRTDSRNDPRCDPQATQKISREELDAVLKRTKSGTRPVTRPDAREVQEPEAPGEAPAQITIVRIDSVELSVIDPSSLPEPSEATADARPSAPRLSPLTSIDTSLLAASVSTPVAPTSKARRFSTTLTHLRTTPRMAFVAGIGVAVLIALIAVVGFLAGRVLH